LYEQRRGQTRLSLRQESRSAFLPKIGFKPLPSSIGAISPAVAFFMDHKIVYQQTHRKWGKENGEEIGLQHFLGGIFMKNGLV
jgi:hypothetical protein